MWPCHCRSAEGGFNFNGMMPIVIDDRDRMTTPLYICTNAKTALNSAYTSNLCTVSCCLKQYNNSLQDPGRSGELNEPVICTHDKRPEAFFTDAERAAVAGTTACK